MIHALEPRRLLAFADDITFGVDGRITDPLGNPRGASFSTFVSFVHELSDGKLLIGGTIYRTDRNPIVRVARYTPGGLPDTTFGGGDALSDPIEVPPAASTAGGAVQPDGKFVLGLTRASGLAAVPASTPTARSTRRSAAGTASRLPAGRPGRTPTPSRATPRWLTTGRSSSSVSARGRTPASSSPASTPTARPTCRSTATASRPSSPGSNAQQVAALPGGKVLIVGNEPEADPFLLRLNDNGAPDATFDGDGVRRFRFTNTSGDEFANSMVLDAGKIVVAGWAGEFRRRRRSSAPAIARFNADGSFDTTFGDGGDGVTATAADPQDQELIVDLARDNQGRYVAVTARGELSASPAPGCSTRRSDRAARRPTSSSALAASRSSSPSTRAGGSSWPASTPSHAIPRSRARSSNAPRTAP